MKIPKNAIKLISELKTPKERKNAFAKFQYRNLEDITEKVKPLLLKYDLLLNISDDIHEIGERLFVKARAKISDGDCAISSIGYAEIDLTRKGMSMEQISGSASSYARKYALAGLLCIDASEDSDSHEQQHDKRVITRTQINQLKKLIKETSSNESVFLSWLQVEKIEDIALSDFARAKKALEKKIQTNIEPL